MKNKLSIFKKNFVLSWLVLSGISAPNFASAFDTSELMTPEEIEYQSSILDQGFSSVAEFNEYMSDPRRDRRPRPPSRRPPPRRRPEPPRRPSPPPARYVYQCYARDDRGFTYMAEDRFDQWYAQREAMRQCYRRSNYCYELGCRQVRR